jgi:hypothetical protein
MRSVRMSLVSIVAGAVVAFGMVITLGVSKVHAARSVEYTWSLVALGQGGWIGGPLFEDGSVGGGGAISLENGNILARLEPTDWTEDEGGNITVCFDILIHKGPADALPPSLCSPPTPPTGTPVHLDFLGIDHNFRITEIR